MCARVRVPALAHRFLSCRSAAAQRHVDGFFRLCDKDSSGSVSFEEFLQEYTRMQMFKALRVLQTKVRVALRTLALWLLCFFLPGPLT